MKKLKRCSCSRPVVALSGVAVALAKCRAGQRTRLSNGFHLPEDNVEQGEDSW